MKRMIVWIVVLAALAAGGYYGYQWYQQRGKPTGSSYRMAKVQRGDLIASISATGTVVPEDVVDVGAQVNGQIASFGNDTDGKVVDYRSTVAEGQVLANIDDALYAAQVASDEASLAQARAAVAVAESTRSQTRAKLEQAQRDWTRAQRLGESQALSAADYDAARSSFEQATANLAVNEAQIGQARAQVAIAEAALQRSRRNLLYCVIKSPVSGVIIDRKVDIGQTVVSSLNAPSLFLIAKDLSRMQVLVQVNEADIGKVAPAASVTFAVDAFPGETFEGKVRKVRLNATMTQNVVTYTVEIVTDNSSLRLLPYLTANVRFITDKRDQVLQVPNSALRWAPSGATASAGQSAGMNGRNSENASQRVGRGGSKAEGEPKGDKRRQPMGDGTVWVMRNGVPTSVLVRTGLSDGNFTEIASDGLKDGDEVIAGEITASAAASGATNPFAPPMFRGGGRGGTGGAGGRPSGGGGGSR